MTKANSSAFILRALQVSYTLCSQENCYSPWSQTGKLREAKPLAAGPTVIALWRQYLTLILGPRKPVLLTLSLT